MLKIARTPKGIVVTSDEIEDMQLGVTPKTRVIDILTEAERFIRNAKARNAARDS